MSGDDWTPGSAALALVCPFCGARAGQGCWTATGRPTPVHSARFVPLTEAFAAGYENGRADQQWIDKNRAAREADRG